MKKSLSLILAIALVFSLFVPAAFAQENGNGENGNGNGEEVVLDSAAKFEELVEAGIFQGHPGGDAALGEEMTRAQAAVVISELFQLDTSNPPATPSFSDVPASHWAYAYIEAAAAAGIINGRTNGEFDPGTVEEIAQGVGYVTLQELAIMLTLAFEQFYGLEIDPNGTVDGNVAPWAEAYVAAAVEQGLLPALDNYTSYASRADLVDASYEAYEYIVENPLPGNEPSQQGIASFEAIGVKKLQVTFNRSVDPEEADFTVKRGNSTRTINEVKFSSNDTVATLEMASKLVEGEYTVSVSGVVEDETLTASVSVEDEKIVNIEILNDYAPLHRDDDDLIYAWIKVENQYGEDITKQSISNLDISPGRGDYRTSSPNIQDDNQIEIFLTGGSVFNLGDKISLSVLDRETGTFTNKILEVALPARIATIEAIELRHEDEEDKEIKVDSDPTEFFIVVEAWDQYGNPVKHADYAEEDISVSVVNRSVIDRGDFRVDRDLNSLVLGLNYQFPDEADPELRAGTAEFIFISRTTGNRETFDVTVGEVESLDSISFFAPEFPVKGEKFEIPFEAYDQFGEEITDIDVIKSGLGVDDTNSRGNISISGAGLNASDLVFREDYVTGRPVIELDAASAKTYRPTESTTVYLTAITDSGKSANMSFNLREVAKPEQISRVADLKTALAEDAKTEIKNDTLKVRDQFDREKNIKDFFDDGYYATIEIVSNEDAIDLSRGVMRQGNDGTIEIVAEEAGRTRIQIELFNDEDERIDDLEIALEVVKDDDIVAYEVEAIGDIYSGYHDNPAAADLYAKEVKVNGKKANGTLVAVTNRLYTVTTSVYGGSGGVVYDFGSNKLVAEGTHVDFDEDDDQTIDVTVSGKVKGGFYTVDLEVVLSSKTPRITTLELDKADGVSVGGSTVDIKKESDSLLSIAGMAGTTMTQSIARDIALHAVVAKDQYGVKWNADLAAALGDAYDFNFKFRSVSFVKKDDDRYTLNVVTQNNRRLIFEVVFGD